MGNNPGDYDIAIADPDLYDAAKNLGVELKNLPARTMPLSEVQADSLGLNDLQEELTTQAGRDIHFVIYQTFDGAKQSGLSLRVPFAYQIRNYFDKQAQKATEAEVAEVAEETEQIQAEEQAQLAEEEAEAEAEAEAMELDLGDE